MSIAKINTIILLHDEALIDRLHRKSVMMEVGNLIGELDRQPEELKRWSIADKEAAYAELDKYKCTIRDAAGGCIFIEEYALEFIEADEDGEFIDGGDLDFAELEIVGFDDDDDDDELDEDEEEEE